MANIIEITLKATDKTKGVLGKVGGALAGVGKAAIKGAAAGFAIAGTAALAFGIKAVMAGADAEEMMSKLNATFGDASADMIDNLDEFATATGRSRYELRAAATDMGAVIKALGATEAEASEMSESMTMLATDLGAFNNLPTADVAHKIRSALTGEFESLKSLGVVINQAKVEQELLNMGVEGGIKDATDYQKAMAIQNIIMRQTIDAQGAATKESGSFTGQMVALKAAMSDATIEIGMKLLPVLTPLITKFATFAAEVLPKVVTWVADKLVPAMAETFRWIADNLVPALTELFKWLGENIPKAIDFMSIGFRNAKLGIQLIVIVFDKISGAISRVIGWIRRVAEKLRSIKLPSWLTGHSPSPFENTLHGISDALKDISGVRLPKFQAALDFGSPPMMAESYPGGAMGSASVGSVSMDNSRIVELLRDISEKPPIDELKLARLIRDAVLQVTG